jgi:hypothetical protein
MAEPQLHLADASWLGAEQWLDVGAPSHPSGSDSATGILPVEPVSSDGRTDAFQRQAIEQQSQVAPYDPQQYAAALDMHCPFGWPALLAEENQASFEPLDHGSFTLGFGTTDYYPMVPFMEGHAPTSILVLGPKSLRINHRASLSFCWTLIFASRHRCASKRRPRALHLHRGLQ